VRAAAAAVAVAYVFEPTLLRWIDGGMLDVPIGLFVFVPILAAAATLTQKGNHYSRELLVVAAFCVGMKPVILALLPLFVVIWAASQWAWLTRRRFAAAMAILLLLGSPWYVMNIIGDGDPYPPLLHALLHKPDRIVTDRDLQREISGVRTPANPLSLLRLPVQFFLNAQTPEFVEYGADGAVALMYLPFIVLGYAIVRRRATRISPGLFLTMASFVYGFAYWVLSSHHARFFLEFMPLYFATLGGLVVWLFRDRSVALKGAALFVLILAAVPSVSAWPYEDWIYEARYKHMDVFVPTSPTFAEIWCDGCLEIKYLSEHVPVGSRVYTVNLAQLTYSLRERGFTNVGNRLSGISDLELRDAVASKSLGTYLSRLSISALLADNSPTFWLNNGFEQFLQQMKALGFHRYEGKARHIVVFIKT
jgi:4-amino-4-deoxy-L-arabinose transferase-like glycosyltransferase